MSRAALAIYTDSDRSKVASWAAQAPKGTRVEFKAPRRSVPQNALMWSLLTEIAEQLPWHGIKLRAEDWKLVLLEGLNREMRVVPNIDGTGFVNLGRSSSNLTKAEMNELIELIYMFGAKHEVTFHREVMPA